MKKLVALWRGLEKVIEGGDYARYCEHLRACHPERRVPTEREFYLSRLDEKYSRPSRCC